MAKKKKVKDYPIGIPWQIARLVRLGKLDLDEACLFALIDALTHRPVGCIAHLEHFAKRMGRGVRSVKRYIQKLIKMQLVVVVSFDGRRRKLKTVSGNALDAACVLGSSAKMARQPGQNGTALRSNKTIRCLPAAKTKPVSGKPAKSEGSFVSNGSSTILNGKSPFLGKDGEFATRLRKFIHSVTRIKPTWQVKTTAKEFGILRRQVNDDKRVSRILRWYCDLPIHGKGLSAFGYIPIATTPKMFKEKFLKIEAAMIKEKGLTKDEYQESLEPPPAKVYTNPYTGKDNDPSYLTIEQLRDAFGWSKETAKAYHAKNPKKRPEARKVKWNYDPS